MFINNLTIGMAVTGDSDALESFFLDYYQHRTNPALLVLEHEVIDTIDYYCLVLEDIVWCEACQTECTALCEALNGAKLSYSICYVNGRMNESWEQSNAAEPFFDYRVRQLFHARKSLVFEDRRYRWFKDWMAAKFDKERLADICTQGVENGWEGLTNYSETTALYEQYHTEIWERAYQDSEEQGHSSILAWMAACNRTTPETDEQFKNWLVWYMAEAIAHELAE